MRSDALLPNELLQNLNNLNLPYDSGKCSRSDEGAPDQKQSEAARLRGKQGPDKSQRRNCGMRTRGRHGL